MYSLGWQVFRDEFGRYVPADRRRRAIRLGALVAGIAAVVLLVVGLLVGWPDLRHPAAVVGTVLLAVAAGTFAVSVVPLLPRAADVDRLSWSGSYMQAPERSERHFRARKTPTIDPRDRDEVLRDAELLRSGLVPDVFRSLVVAVAIVLGAVALVLLGLPLRIVTLVPLFLVIRTVMSLVRLGRIERVRALAAVLPDVDPRRGTTPATSAHGDRIHRPASTGSKLSLPDE